jgi:hypothetical protein
MKSLKVRIDKAIKELQKLDSLVWANDVDGSLEWVNHKILEIIGSLNSQNSYNQLNIKGGIQNG